MKRIVGLVVVGATVMLLGCSDKAAPKYEECLKLDTNGDVRGATEACSAAVAADPASKAGKGATQKLTELAPKLAKLKEDEAAKAAAAAEQQRQQAQAQAEGASLLRAAQAKALRGKVQIETWGAERDEDCTGKGKPPYRKDYTGGTYDEDEQVALADGCKRLFSKTSSPESTTYCCPRP